MTRRFALLLLACFWFQGCALLNSDPPIQAGPFITEFGVVGSDEGGRTSVEASRAIELTKTGQTIGFRVLPAYDVPFEAYTVLYMPEPAPGSTSDLAGLQSGSGYVARAAMKRARGETFLSSRLEADDPVGSYTAELYLDGRVISKVRFEVSRPATDADLP